MIHRPVKALLLITGVALVAWGYHLLSIPADAGHDLMLKHAKNGMLSVVIGGALLMTWLAKQ